MMYICPWMYPIEILISALSYQLTICVSHFFAVAKEQLICGEEPLQPARGRYLQDRTQVSTLTIKRILPLLQSNAH